MVKRGMLLIWVLVLAGLFAGCGGPAPAGTPLEAPGDLMYEDLQTTERFRMYESIGLVPFSSEGAVFMSTDADERPEMEAFAPTANMHLIKGFTEEMKDNYYPRFGVVKDEADKANYDLIIEGKYLEFDRGNAAGRFWGVGGMARVSVAGTMTETATGKVVANFRDTKQDGRNLGSIYLMEDCCEEIGANLSDFLEEVY